VIARRGALLLLALFVSAGFGELGLRALGLGEVPLVSWQTEGLHRPDVELIYSLTPGASAEWRSDEFVEHVQINSEGFRDDETPSRRPGDARVLVLGDSMTFGHGVDDDETYPNQLEALFRREGRDVHVINAGVRGYGTDHQYRYFVSRLRAMHPDLVVFAFYTNDVSDGIERPLYTLEGGQLIALDGSRQRVYRIGRVYAWLPGWLRHSRLVGFAVERGVAIGAYPEAPLVRPPELIQQVRERIEVQLRELERLSKEDGFRLILLGIPHRDRNPQKDPYQWLHALEFSQLDWFDPSADLEWSRDREQLFFHGDDHLSAAGNRRLAERLHRYIVENELLPAPEVSRSSPPDRRPREASHP